MSKRRAGPGLRGRGRERTALDRLLDEVRAGQSRVLILRGEAGIGKTALLDYLQGQASGCRVARAAGVESEMEIAFAGLHQLCAPMLGSLARLPGPQRDALSTALGLSPGEAPDRLLVGLAALGLLSEAAEERPLVCLVDDAQWLDHASAQALAFVARRLLAESVAVVFSVREPSGDQELAGLPELVVLGLSDADARALLDSVIPGRLDEQVRDRIVAETRGNPLALVELPRGLTAAELAGGFGRPDARPLASRIEQSFGRQLESLPSETQRLLLIAAAEPVGDVTLLWSAAERLGIGADAAAPAEAAGLIELGPGVRFRHPMVRTAAYWAATPPDRRQVHRALAEATDPVADPDRRAWHRAHSAVRPDEAVADELERSAGRAQARGGLAAAAAFLERATELTPDPGRRVQRALDAAQAKLQAGAFDQALVLLATAEAGPLDELQRARIDLLRAQIAFASSRGNEATPLLLAAARRLEPLDVELAHETYLDAFSAAMFAGRLASGPGLREVALAARGAPRSHRSRRGDILLDGLAVLFTDGYAAATPISRRALRAFCSEDISVEEGLRWLWLASVIAADLWDDESWNVLSARHVKIARDAGALSELSLALNSRTVVHLFAGELTAAASLVEEARAVTEATGTGLAPYGALHLAAWQGSEGEAGELFEATMSETVPRGEGIGVTVTQWARALLSNGLGRYNEALVAARQAAEYPHELAAPNWGLTELIEAASRRGMTELAADALQQLSEMTRASSTDWALGVESRSRALLSDGDTAERLYRKAIEHLDRTRVRMELGRAYLLYGEWLRRERRRVEAREALRTAHDMFGRFGALAFAERARRELQATGETVRKRTVEAHDVLTAQEAHVARLAADGHTNPEIGARLFISARTAEYHLHKVFSKLDIGSRRQLRGRLAQLELRTS
jgi:DNA-binding CsgD family transcriptional regulator/tetratricopeptide (TPR) repeat protein